MRKWITLSESLLYMNMPEEDPAEQVEFKGLTFERQRCPQPIGTLWFVIHPTLYTIACFVVESHESTINIHCEVDDDYQRSGYGTIIYQFCHQLADRSGKKLLPSPHQSKAGEAFWANKGELLTQTEASEVFHRGLEGTLPITPFNLPPKGFADAIMEAGEAGVLYHWMDMTKAEAMFDNDVMEARWKHRIGGRDVLGNSFSRNKVFSFGEERFVRLTVDKQALGARNKIIPLDAEFVHAHTYNPEMAKRFAPQDRHQHSRTGAQFAEEFVVGDIVDLSRCIIKVDVRGYNSGRYHSFCQVLKQYCHTHDLDYAFSEEARKQLKDTEDRWAEDDD